jgi:hypothetical protein
MTDVVLGGILRAARIEERPRTVFEVGGAVAFADECSLDGRRDKGNIRN